MNRTVTEDTKTWTEGTKTITDTERTTERLSVEVRPGCLF